MSKQERAGSTILRGFSASLPMKLMRAREAVMVRFRAMLRENGLTEQQWRVLRALDGSDTIDVSRLADATYLLGPSLTRILRDLEAQRLIRTEVDRIDQRRKLVALTEMGRERIASIAPLSEAIYEEITLRFGRERLEQLELLLDEVRDRLA